MDTSPARWTGHRGAQALWVFIIVLDVVALVIAVTGDPTVLSIITPASTIVVAAILLRQSIRTRRYYAQQG